MKTLSRLSKALHSRMHSRRVRALFLSTLVILSSFVIIYSITELYGAQCPSNSKPFQETSMPFHTIFVMTPPDKGTICLTAHITGELPIGGLSLVPGLGLYTTGQSSSVYSACSNSGTDCGGFVVSASPARVFFSPTSIRILVTIDTPVGSTRGDYWLLFWPCQGGGILWLRVGNLNQTPQNPLARGSLCPLTSFHTSLAFNGYAGLIPAYQNRTAPPLF